MSREWKARRDHLVNLDKDDAYGHILLTNPDMIFTMDSSGSFLFVSPSFEAHTGYTVERMQGRGFREFIHPSDLPHCENYFSEMLSGGQPRPGLEYRVSHAGGGWRWHTVSGASVKDEEGGFLYFIGVARDVTQRKRSEEALLSAYRKLERLAGDHSRDLRAIAREQSREVDRRRLLESELEATQKHLAETVARMQSGIAAEKEQARVEMYDELSPVIASLSKQLEWLAAHLEGAHPSAVVGLREAFNTVQELDRAAQPSAAGKANAAPVQGTPSPPRAESAAPHEGLSDSEYAVMKGILEGKTIKNIAAELCIRPSTASTYHSRLLRKLQVKGDAGLIRYGIEHGLKI
jgi:PAS domain S-box-containing protein